MNETKSLRSIAWLAPLALLLVTSTAMANDVVNPKITPGVVVFDPVDGLERGEMTMTVSGPKDCYLERDFKEGETPFFKVVDQYGEIIPDGEYSFHVTFRPILNSTDRAKLKAARKNNDPREIKLLKEQGVIRPTLADGGYFSVFRGEFVDVEVKEDRGRSVNAGLVSDPHPVSSTRQSTPSGEDGLVGVTLADFVISDDLIVDGSACIGFDCVNGEVFSFDTIRLKENNLRIKFDDTSVAASFPRNDWQLTANASANGGASKFSIDDVTNSRTPFTVEANAPSNSLYVDDGGRIGNGTSTPSVEVHTVDGDTPTLRLQQDGSSGFEPQTWDVAGNETNFFVRDVTNGSALPFRIRPGAPSSSIFVDVDGDVGLGTSSPTAAAHVRRSNGTAQLLIEDTSAVAAARGLLTLTNNGGSFFTLHNTAAATDWFFTHENSAPNRFLINDGTGVDFALSKTGDLTIAGTLITGGPTCAGGCDEVLEPDYELESIEEHAASMYQGGFLPAVGPTIPKAPINLTEKTGGILNELEKAHIYIEQLHAKMLALEARLVAIEGGEQ